MDSLKEKKKKQIVIVVLLLLVISGLSSYIILYNQPREVISGSYLPTEKDAKKISNKERDKLAEKEVDKSKFTLNIYPEAYFEKGDKEGAIFIKNDISNAYPIAVDITLDKSGDVVYESGAIKPGYEITSGKLQKKLSKGNYKCTANVSIFDPKTKKYKGQTAAEVILNVKA